MTERSGRTPPSVRLHDALRALACGTPNPDQVAELEAAGWADAHPNEARAELLEQRRGGLVLLAVGARFWLQRRVYGVVRDEHGVVSYRIASWTGGLPEVSAVVGADPGGLLVRLAAAADEHAESVSLCLYIDPGAGTPIGWGRTWAEARASTERQVASGVDALDPDRCTIELAASYAASHALDGLSAVRMSARTDAELRAILRGLGVSNPAV